VSLDQLNGGGGGYWGSPGIGSFMPTLARLANPSVNLWNQYQGATDPGVKDAMIRQMQGTDAGAAFNANMKTPDIRSPVRHRRRRRGRRRRRAVQLHGAAGADDHAGHAGIQRLRADVRRRRERHGFGARPGRRSQLRRRLGRRRLLGRSRTLDDEVRQRCRI